MSAGIIGSTGLVGNQVLKALEKNDSVDKVYAITRRAVDKSSDKVENIIEKDSANWPEVIKDKLDGGRFFFSAFGTTRAAAGGIENFKKIDYGVNYAAAKAAREAGVSTYVLVSATGASESSFFPYMKSKGKLENDVIALKFPHTIILRPGALIGKRENSHGFLNSLGEGLGRLVYPTPLWCLLQPTHAEEVAQAAVHLATQTAPAASDGEKVTIVGSRDIIKTATAARGH
ncbi:Piso0_002354 [Millerozyma farinosa CBS 7064]|uniref:Piso0_002354 protein n=1 Tax=Pichia sorbitophila (strain ATCC MYA-4447 / BCRC 22081 / CBS 7064 / NBRC 10061 / NRRL Y-12695) TaxID=559304 RepID=G8YCE1_PICSO|nr:Piso0_002354 [Millerozyma farinosa CBS 7064]